MFCICGKQERTQRISKRGGRPKLLLNIIDILEIIDYLSQLMYKSLILAAMSAARQQVGQYTARVYGRAGAYETVHYTRN